MINARAKVLLLDILQADAVVIQHTLIHRQHGSIRSRYLYEGRDGVDHQTQIPLAGLQSLFNLLAIIDVRVDAVPLDDRPRLVTKRIRPEQKPAIAAVMPPQSR